MADLYWKPGDPLKGPEKWAPIAGYEGVYEVSTHGRVRRIAGGQGTRPGTIGGRVLKAFPGAGRSRLYIQVHLCLRGVQKTHRIHVLVAHTFLGEPPEEEIGGYYNKMQVGHIDTNPANNHADNLEYTSQRENREEQWHRYTTEGYANG